MTTTKKVQELAATLEQDVSLALGRVREAEEALRESEEALRRAQLECQAANEALSQVQRQHEGFQQIFADVLDVSASDMADAASRSPSLQLLPALAATKAAASRTKGSTSQIAEMPAAEKLKHVLGGRTMTLDEIRTELQALSIVIPNLQKVLSASAHNVRDAKGKWVRDAKGGLMKRKTFTSLSRGVWRAAQPDGYPSAELAVLSRTEAQAEMVMNRRSVN